jgi:hypothetical protein
MKKIILAIALLISSIFPNLSAQQPQTQTAPISAINAKYVQGIGIGFWPKPVSGLNLKVSAGTVNCSGTVQQYADTTLTLTTNTTNYIFLNTSSSCVPSAKTTQFTSSDIPIGIVTTGVSTITNVLDVRSMFQTPNNGGGGPPSGTASGMLSGSYPNPSLVNTIDIQQAPYYASGSSFTTTTTASSGSTSITVASCGDFISANAGAAYGSQGISISGAGTSGAYYIGTVTTCVGTSMVITPATTTSVTGATVRHDETAAWQAALNTVGYGSVTNIACPSGTYNINGPQQTVGSTSAILLFPSLNYFSNPLVAPAQLSITGVVPPVRGATVGCILQTAQTSATGSLFSTYATDSGSPWGNQSNIEVYLTNVVMRAYDNPNITMWNGFYLAGMWLQNVFVDTGLPPNCGYDPSVCGSSQTVPPTHSNAIAIITPQLDNYGDVILSNVRVYGFYTSAQLQEHADLEGFWGSWGVNCLVFNNTTGHAIHGGHVNCEHDTTDLSGTSIGFRIDELSNESQFTTTGTTTIISDPSNNLFGSFNYENYYVTGQWSTTFSNGGSNVSYCNLLNGSCKQAGAASISGATSVGSLTINNITGLSQCAQVSTSGVVSGSGTPCSGATSSPTFKQYQFVSDTTGISVTSPSMTVTAGDILFVSCRFGTGSTGIATDSQGNSYTAGLAVINGANGLQLSYATASTSGTIQFTCTQSSSIIGISLIAMDFSGPTTGLSTTVGTNEGLTTIPFNTSQRTLLVECGSVGGLATWSPYVLGGSFSHLVALSSGSTASDSTADQACEETVTTYPVDSDGTIQSNISSLAISTMMALNY